MFVVLLHLVRSPLSDCSSSLDLVGPLALPALFFVSYFLLIWCLFLMVRLLYLGGLLVGRLACAELLLQVIRCVLFPLFSSQVCNQICAQYASHCKFPGPSDCSAYSLFPCCAVCFVWPLAVLVLDLFLPFPEKKYGRLVKG